MEKLNVNNLYIEITRDCNLECSHCLRGDRENIYMTNNTINNIFKNVKSINKLLLTGGEPMLALKQISEIIYSIKKYNIEIESINIITNGSILTSNHLKLLKKLSNTSKLNIYVSSDKFHLIELEKNNLIDKRNRNVEILKDLFGAKEYAGIDVAQRNNVSIKLGGRATLLSRNDLERINNYKTKTKYIIRDNNNVEFTLPYYTDDSIKGNISIDVNGNIINDSSLTFNQEDLYSLNNNVNINTLNMLNIIENILTREVSKISENGDIWNCFYKQKLNNIKTKLKKM